MRCLYLSHSGLREQCPSLLSFVLSLQSAGRPWVVILKSYLKPSGNESFVLTTFPNCHSSNKLSNGTLLILILLVRKFQKALSYFSEHDSTVSYFFRILITNIVIRIFQLSNETTEPWQKSKRRGNSGSVSVWSTSQLEPKILGGGS